MVHTGWDESDIPDQRGRVAVVTGANAGLGRETARQLAIAGATVVLACRSTERGRAALEDLRASAPGTRLELQELDLASLESVRAAAAGIRDRFERIDLLINNAGVMYTERSRTAEGFELQFGTNHLGHFAFTGLLLDRLRDVAGSRIVTVGSNGHRLPFKVGFDDLRAAGRYNRFAAYTRSKLANQLFAHELHRRLTLAGGSTISVAAHPGGSDTELARHFPGADLVDRHLHVVVRLLAQPPSQGALPILRAATDPLATGGRYYGPDGFLEMQGHPIVVRPSARSQDPGLQARLWAISEEATGVSFGLGAGPAPAPRSGSAV